MLELVDTRTRQNDAFRADVLAGLSASRKTLPSRWLYDDRGCELFEAITQLDEYYPTRTETAILQENATALAEFCGKETVLLEYGAGAAIKTEIVLGALESPRLYVPIDIAADFLEQTAARIQARFQHLRVHPLAADFTSDFEIPDRIAGKHRVAFFPGSTIGNLDAAQAHQFLQRLRRHVGRDGRAVIGADLKKDIPVLIAAYDDRQGITAAFNLNLLRRINRELDGDFVLGGFAHEARWNAADSAIEMHLTSLRDQIVNVAGKSFGFRLGETIHTESSRKYTIAGFSNLAEKSGWRSSRTWTDAAQRFALFGLQAA